MSVKSVEASAVCWNSRVARDWTGTTRRAHMPSVGRHAVTFGAAGGIWEFGVPIGAGLWQNSPSVACRVRSQDDPLTKKMNQAEPTPVSIDEQFAALLAKLPLKERSYAEKRDLAMEADPAKRNGWRRLCVFLLELAGHSSKFNSKESVQFYAADGKYRMQIFALQDVVPGELTIHCRDVLDQLIEKKLIRRSKVGTDLNRYVVAGTEVSLVIERVPQQAADHPQAFRDLLSWNRKCMRIDLPVAAPDEVYDRVEKMLALGLPDRKA